MKRALLKNIRRITSRFYKGGHINGGHKVRFKISKDIYLKPVISGVRGSWYNHPFPDATHVDWTKEPERMQICKEIWIWWLCFRFYIEIGHGKQFQHPEDVIKRNAVNYKKRSTYVDYSMN